MIFVYAAVVIVLLVVCLAKKGYKTAFFEGLEKKEHPLRFFYGAALALYEIYTGFIPEKADSKVSRMVKSLCVKENVHKEVTLYYVKKIAFCICLLLAVSALGFIYCAADTGISAVTTLTRNEYGGGSASYELGIVYDGKEDTVQIEIEERLYTDEEIYALFEEAYDEVAKELAADNESLESVSGPLDLVSGYGQIDIYWEIEDSESIDKNGQITAEIEEGESLTVNLYATFSLEDVTALYVYPVTLVPETLSEKEILISGIMEAIEENNDVYESEVVLPEEINGISVYFTQIKDSNRAIFLILGLVALAAVIFAYDRRLEEKMKKRESQMLLDFTEIVTKLNLLYEAGLSIFKAWERIITDHEKKGIKEEHFAYQEMKLAGEKIKNGMSEKSAYEEFGRRCGLHQYIKLANILSQNISKGSRGMRTLLELEAETAFEERKRLARKKGEEAGTKLLLPMMLLLVIVIVIVAVPALMSISL